VTERAGITLDMSNRGLLIVALVLLAAGIALAAAGSSVFVMAVGWALFGIALVLLVSLLFLLVGESEDRDRARNPRG
jgi:hypothetical protein